MQIFIGLALIIAILAAVFAWQNPMVMAVQFFGWKFNGSIAFICLAIFAMGFLTNFFFSIASVIRYRWLIYKQKKRIDLLEQKLADQEAHPVFDTPPNPQ